MMINYLTFSQLFLRPSDKILLHAVDVVICTAIKNSGLYAYITFEDILSVVYFLRSIN